MSENFELVLGDSLITNTLEEGRRLAIKMPMLIAAGHTVAVGFATIAASNKYWVK